MNDIPSDNNVELDPLAEETDALEGERVLNRIYEFLGRFVSYPST